MKCQWHLCNNEVAFRVKTYCPKIYCSRLCGIKQATLVKRDRYKRKAVEYKGGKCQSCGYNKCLRALSFHHRNPVEKEFGLSTQCWGFTWDKIQRELDKCDLLCANCHLEHHSDTQNILEGRLV